MSRAEELWNHYNKKEKLVVDTDIYKDIFEELDVGTADENILAILYPYIDRGVSCWETFLELISINYPKCETLFVAQNYTCHFNDTCSTPDHWKKDIKNDLLDAFSKSNIKNLFVLDWQSFQKDFYDTKSPFVKQCKYGDRLLYIEKSSDKYIDNSSTLRSFMSNFGH